MGRNPKLEADSAANRLTQVQVVRLGAQRLAEIILREAGSNTRLQTRLRKMIAEAADGSTDQQLPNEQGEPHMVGGSPPMLAVFKAIRKLGGTDAPVLIRGDSGTGKELAALAIHERSTYARGPFVAVNCGGIPATLIASELFGHEKGSFTGAYQRQIGRIESARGGTLFLDEIGDLPLELQIHLLRFLQEKTIERVGGHRPIEIDTRVIAATHRNLEDLMEEGNFREDLFYRLNVLRIDIPPMRERGEDLELLSTYFLRKFAGEMNREMRGFEPAALKAIREHSWPGNVRELISCVRRAVVMAEGDQIMASDLAIRIRDDANRSAAIVSMPESETVGSRSPMASYIPNGATTLQDAKNRFEKELLCEMLERNSHNMTATAQELSVSRVTLYRLVAKHNLQSNANGSPAKGV